MDRLCSVCDAPASMYDYFVKTTFRGERKAYRLRVCFACRDILEVMLEEGLLIRQTFAKRKTNTMKLPLVT